MPPAHQVWRSIGGLKDAIGDSVLWGATLTKRTEIAKPISVAH
jgi:hypothetical protein